MLILFNILLTILESMYGLWTLYLATMNLIRVHKSGTMSRTTYLLALPIVIVGYALDIAINMTLMTVILFELPQWRFNKTKRFGIEVEWTVTARLSRHIHDSEGRRKSIALWFGSELLDQFDPSGRHLR